MFYLPEESPGSTEQGAG